jgi:predicted NBD/HSP70 family sugar kinase
MSAAAQGAAPAPSPSGGGQGSNSALIRQFNERVVLAGLRRLGYASKADIARHAGLTSNAAGVIVRALSEAGLVIELGKKRAGGRGQPATLLALDPSGAYAVGVRIDRGTLETVLVDFAGQPIDRCHRTVSLPPPDETVALIAGDIGRLAAGLPAGASGRLVGIGLGVPFNLESWLEQLDLAPETYRRWARFDIAAALAAATGLPVTAENDGTAAAVAELFYGLGRHHDDFLYFFIGPAIGGGVVQAGQYVRGVSGNAGDVGMMPVPRSTLASAHADGRRHDILLGRASLNALMRHLRFTGATVAGLDDLGRAVAAHPAAVEEWLTDCVDALAWAVLAAVAVLDVPLVVVDGDLDRAVLARLIARLTEALAAGVPESRVPPVLAAGSFGGDAGAIGAASLPLHLTFSPNAAILTGQHDEWSRIERIERTRGTMA